MVEVQKTSESELTYHSSFWFGPNTFQKYKLEKIIIIKLYIYITKILKNIIKLWKPQNWGEKKKKRKKETLVAGTLRRHTLGRNTLCQISTSLLKLTKIAQLINSDILVTLDNNIYK